MPPNYDRGILIPSYTTVGGVPALVTLDPKVGSISLRAVLGFSNKRVLLRYVETGLAEGRPSNTQPTSNLQNSTLVLPRGVIHAGLAVSFYQGGRTFARMVLQNPMCVRFDLFLS